MDGRRAAIAEAVRRAEPGDVIALLGKGHERGQEINGQIHPFDDRVELAAALTERFGDRVGGPAADGAAEGAAQRSDGGGHGGDSSASVPAGGRHDRVVARRDRRGGRRRADRI